jgi:catechol 1,2-dioxygenase
MQCQRVIVALFLGLLIQGCRSHYEPVNIQDYIADYELICQPASDQSVIRIVGEEEVGERLFLVGQLVDETTKQPIGGAKIFFFQANYDGVYDSRFIGMPSFARISGSLRTDANGCFIVKTIIPGNYPDQVDGKHIHARIKAPGYPTWKMEFLFEGHLDDALRQEYLTRGDGVILNPVETLMPGIFLAESRLEIDAE